MKALKMILVAAVLALPATAASAATKDILSTAAESGKFTTLLKAVEAAGLSEKLKGPGPFTLFAPSDDAFGKIDGEAMTELLDPANREELIGLLKAHVVSGKVMATDIGGASKSLKTAAGTEIKIDGTNGLRAGDAAVVASIVAANGVIHIVDSVIEPEIF